MFAVQGVYADGMVKIDEYVPVNKKYDVVVTFIKPAEMAEKKAERERKVAALNRITGFVGRDVPLFTMAQIEEWAKAPEIQALTGALKETNLPADISISDIRNDRLADKYTI